MLRKWFKIKKLIITALIICLPINCFAGIISENDGSGFISKSEYDTAVSMFRNAINEYYTNIDVTINDAIRAYFSQISYRYDIDSKILYFEHCTKPSVWCRKYTDMQYLYTDAAWHIRSFLAGNYTERSRVYSKTINSIINVASESLASRMYVSGFLDELGNKKYRFAGFTNNLAVSRNLVWCKLVQSGADRPDAPYAGGIQTWWTHVPDFNIGDYKEIKTTDNYTFYMGIHPIDGNTNNDFGRLSSIYNYTKMNENDFLFDSNITEEANIYFFDEDMQGIAYTQNGFTNRLEKDWWADPRCTLAGGGAMIITSTTMVENVTGKAASSDTSTYIVEDAPIDKRLWSDIYNSDTTDYSYYDEDSIKRDMNAYPINAGIPIVVLNKGDKFTWEPFFEDAGQHNIYFFWGPNAGSLNETNTIPVKVDDGTATWQPEIGQTGKISFEADRNGILFAKWRSTDATISAGMNVEKSKNCKINRIHWF